MKVYVIKGDPIPLARARHVRNRIYDPQKTLKAIAAIDLAGQHDNLPFLSGPLHLDVTFYMKAPDSISQKRRELLYRNPHIFKPDLDNLVKYVCDISSGVIYQDDCIISSITTKKVYDENARTEFSFTSLPVRKNDNTKKNA